jgi:hypothetical protein
MPPVVARYSVNCKLFQSVLFEPVVKIGFGCVVATGDKLLGGAIYQQALDLKTIRIEFAFPGARRSSEYRLCVCRSVIETESV